MLRRFEVEVVPVGVVPVDVVPVEVIGHFSEHFDELDLWGDLLVGLLVGLLDLELVLAPYPGVGEHCAHFQQLAENHLEVEQGEGGGTRTILSGSSNS